MALWLTDEELVELTGKVHRQTQLDAIRSIQPPVIYRVRGDGFLLVDRWQFLAPVPCAAPNTDPKPSEETDETLR